MMHLFLLQHHDVKNMYKNAFIMYHHVILVSMYAFAISYTILMHLGSTEEITLLEFNAISYTSRRFLKPRLLKARSRT